MSEPTCPWEAANHSLFCSQVCLGFAFSIKLSLCWPWVLYFILLILSPVLLGRCKQLCGVELLAGVRLWHMGQKKQMDVWEEIFVETRAPVYGTATQWKVSVQKGDRGVLHLYWRKRRESAGTYPHGGCFGGATSFYSKLPAACCSLSFPSVRGTRKIQLFPNNLPDIPLGTRIINFPKNQKFRLSGFCSGLVWTHLSYYPKVNWVKQGASVRQGWGAGGHFQLTWVSWQAVLFGKALNFASGM